MVHRDELIEHTVIEHQTHAWVGRIILQTEESLRSVVGLHIVHTRLGYQPLVLLTIGRESHSTMEEDFQIGPYLLKGAHSGLLQNTQQNRQHPRGYAAQVGHVGMQSLPGNALTLLLEVGKQSCLLAGNTHKCGRL